MDNNNNYNDTNNSKMPTPEEFIEYMNNLKNGPNFGQNTTNQNGSYKPKIDLFNLFSTVLTALYPALNPTGTPAKLIATTHKVLSIPGVLPVIKDDIAPLIKDAYNNYSTKMKVGGISSLFKGKKQSDKNDD